MRITLVLGGARSGKSRWATAEALRLGGERVAFVATAPTDTTDEEMARRIAHHRRDRPERWQTVEEPDDPRAALDAAAHDVVVMDCLTILLANRMRDAASEAAADEAGRAVVDELLDAARKRSGDLIVVSNEVGQGVVPAHPLGRWFRDVQGRANQAVAREAERVALVVAGIPLWVKGESRGRARGAPTPRS